MRRVIGKSATVSETAKTHRGRRDKDADAVQPDTNHTTPQEPHTRKYQSSPDISAQWLNEFLQEGKDDDIVTTPGSSERVFTAATCEITPEAEVKREVTSDGKEEENKRLEQTEHVYASGTPIQPESQRPPLVPEEDESTTLYFRDGKRRIDFILAYEDSGDPDQAAAQEIRKLFERNLMEEGVELETEDKIFSQDGKTFFVKIHLPWEVLCKFGELMNLKMPVKMGSDADDNSTNGDVPRNAFERAVQSQTHIDSESEMDEEVPWEGLIRRFSWWGIRNICSYDKKLIPDETRHYTLAFDRKRQEIFRITDKDTFFSYSQRSRIAWEILMRTSCGDEVTKTGIMGLLSEEIYLAAYPLHDGSYATYKNTDEVPPTAVTQRNILYNEWSRPQCWYKIQPLGLVRKYFGEKTGLYFAWLGFYTKMLIPAAGLGVLTMFYGVSTMDTNIPGQEVCDENGPGNTIMCPLCERTCTYWRLREDCLYNQVVHLFDNSATVAFAICMSLWATLFMEMWKRKQARLAWEWDLTDYDYDQVREPFLPSWKKMIRIAGVNSIVLLMLCIVIGTVFGVIVYRIAMITLHFAHQKSDWHAYVKFASTFSPAILSLIVILIMDKIYRKIAFHLTEMERPRTQVEYEDSFTVKMFLFQFINHYSSLIYIAFFKGRFYGHPGSRHTLFGLKLDQCHHGGCLFELSIQLGVIMVGKQVINNIAELGTAKAVNWWRSWRRSHDRIDGHKFTGPIPRWEQDYNLQDGGSLALFDEYLEMVVQFGFVTLFVAAFPLAPLFALLNNIVEIRLDAYKYVTQLRRPLASTVPNIGAWQSILQGISVLAVISNAFVISHTSEFIPRLVYQYSYSPDKKLHGYVNSSLSIFNTSDFDEATKPESDTIENNKTVEECSYEGYRLPPNHRRKYEFSEKYWQILAIRIIFVVVFEHLVFFVTWFVAYIIPDVPRSVRWKMRRERWLARESLQQGGDVSTAASRKSLRSSVMKDMWARTPDFVGVDSAYGTHYGPSTDHRHKYPKRWRKRGDTVPLPDSVMNIPS